MSILLRKGLFNYVKAHNLLAHLDLSSFHSLQAFITCNIFLERSNQRFLGSKEMFLFLPPYPDFLLFNISLKVCYLFEKIDSTCLLQKEFPSIELCFWTKVKNILENVGKEILKFQCYYFKRGSRVKIICLLEFKNIFHVFNSPVIHFKTLHISTASTCQYASLSPHFA